MTKVAWVWSLSPQLSYCAVLTYFWWGEAIRRLRRETREVDGARVVTSGHWRLLFTVCWFVRGLPSASWPGMTRALKLREAKPQIEGEDCIFWLREIRNTVGNKIHFWPGWAHKLLEEQTGTHSKQHVILISSEYPFSPFLNMFPKWIPTIRSHAHFFSLQVLVPTLPS